MQLHKGPEPDGLDKGFGPSRRLHEPREFGAVLAARQTLRSRHFVLHYTVSEQGKARLGLVIGRKFLKTAVERNLVKRLARESFRGQRLPDMDLVLRLTSPTGQSGRRELRAELDALLMRLVQ